MGHSTARASARDDAPAVALVGRDAELRAGRAAVAEGAGVVLCAPPGCGTSALAAVLAPDPAARIVATPAGRLLPLWALRATLASDGDDETATITATDPVVVADQLVRHLAAHRAGGRRTGPPVLLVEQIDDLDDPSLAIVVDLVSSGRLRLVATRRSTAPAPAAVAALWRDGGVRRLDVGPLDDEASAELVRTRLGGDVDGRTMASLVALAAGAPAALVALVDAARADRSLRRTGGLWRLEAPPVLPADLIERAEAELAALDAAEREGLELLAVAGPLPLDLAEEACGASVLESLERRGQIGADAAGRFGPSSPLVGRHLAIGLPPLARRRLTDRLAAVADALGTTDRDDELGLRSVVWHLDVDRPLPAERLLRAAHQAIDEGDPDLGERLAEASARAHPTAAAVLLQSWCADERGRTDRAVQILIDHVPEDDEAAAALTIRRAEQCFWHDGDRDGAHRVLDEGARLPAPWNLAIRAQRHVFEVLEGAVPAALAGTGDLLHHEEPLVGSTAALAGALALVVDDRPDEAQAVANAALGGLAGPTPVLYIDPGVHVIALGFALHGLGQVRAADELTDAVYRHALGRPGLQAQGWSALLHSIVLTAAGRPSEATAVALEAEHIWASADIDGLATWCAAAAALAAAERADRATVAEALERIDRYATGPFTLFDPWVDRARAWALELDGDRGAAVQRLAQAGADAADAGRPALAAAVAHDLVRLGDPARAGDLLRSLDRSSPLTQLRTRLADAAAHADADGLAAVASAFAEGGADGWAAEAGALAALAAPVRAAAIRPGIASLTARTGLATPPIAQLLATAERRGLTRREEEIVALASDGLSNRAIADTLVVSIRTVENHLHRAFAKLGVASRAELLDPTDRS